VTSGRRRREEAPGGICLQSNVDGGCPAGCTIEDDLASGTLDGCFLLLHISVDVLICPKQNLT
jgi:hypothetical protein